MEKAINIFFPPRDAKSSGQCKCSSDTAALLIIEEGQFVIPLSGLQQISLFLKKTEQK